MPAAVLALVVIGIVVAIGAKITNTLSGTLSAGTAAKGAADNATLGIAEVGGWLPTVGLVIAAALIIGLVVGAFAYFGSKR